jgi:nucleoside diphosphate kinase
MSIAAAAWLPLLPEGRAAAFYKEHAGRFFYNRLTSFMQSGPVLALCLAAPPGCDAVTAWRTLLGPTKVARARLTHLQTLRGALGLSDTRNLGHGSDAAATAAAELALFFPSLTMAEDSQDLEQGLGLGQASSAGVHVERRAEAESGASQLMMMEEGCSLARRVMKCGASELPLGAALVSQADGGTLGLDSRADEQAASVAASLLRAAGWDVLNAASDR